MGLRLKKRIGTVAVTSAMVGVMTLSTSIFAATSVNSEYQSRFQEMYQKIHNASNGYFSSDGIPYHSPETFIIEGPDYGHETTSETYSFYMWLEAMNGKFTGDFSGFQKAWDSAEKNIIPTDQDQLPTSMSKYNASKPATYAPEYYTGPQNYPSKLDTNAAVGSDPINSDLVSAYGTSTMYGMHWLLDTDNWYGYGRRGDGTSKPSYINTFQRGPQESTFETIPQPSWDDMTRGGKNGYLDLFTGDNSYSKQFKYTDAPDADARAVQATYWAEQWAKEQGKDISTYTSKAAKMGDYLRYSLFDKYFRQIGNSSQKGNGYDSCMYLMSWYYAWGGATDGGWSWKTGSSIAHSGYQNPFTAWVLSTDSGMKPKSQNGATDWGKTLDRTLELYQWLQSSEGAIAGGVNNSLNGCYDQVPAGTSTFYGMAYDPSPAYLDPESNKWFGMQAWTMQRLAQYYYETKDSRAKGVLDKWVNWVKSVVKLNSDGTFQIPSDLQWTGQPDTWNKVATNNSNLHVAVKTYGTDLGVTGSLANTLLYYSKASGDDSSRALAKELLDRTWKLYKDDKGVAVPETRADYKRINDPVYVPSGWTGTMPNGDKIDSNSTFISIRSKYKQDPGYTTFQNALSLGKAPEYTYHRFWAETETAVANGTYAILFPNVTIKGDLNGDGSVNSLDLVLMKRYLVNQSTKIDTDAADMNSDGTINSVDAALLKRVLLGK